MEDERVISFERGKQLADQLGVEFFETSAKENVNVKVKIMHEILNSFKIFHVFNRFIVISILFLGAFSPFSSA